jgi:hypothetical protein
MARQGIKVELAAYLADQEPRALKKGVSAPIAYRVAHFIDVLREAHEARSLGDIGPTEIVSALIHAQEPNREDLQRKLETYRTAFVYEGRESLGEITKQRGSWWIRLPGRGQQW